ncbi:hypothetical protein RRG08_025356 [Elysia crispata]|uniref:Uncharacterized protein n=1 Tax=Elysia crispata TaxID=231223 RepID=A0AAE1E9W9_9GAST|nr:hypothetical protein RRG08_025356 [Elysia crispata]
MSRGRVIGSRESRDLKKQHAYWLDQTAAPGVKTHERHIDIRPGVKTEMETPKSENMTLSPSFATFQQAQLQWVSD